MGTVKVDDQLVDRARTHKMTASERRHQQASFVMGIAGSKISREQITEVLREADGYPISKTTKKA